MNVILPTFLSSCYSAIRKDRNKHGGGVIILIDTNIGATEFNNINVHIKHAWCSFNVGDDSYLLGAIYRPPNNDETYLSNVTETISKMCLTYLTHNILITGDLNLPQINWVTVTPLHNDKLTVEFLNYVLSNNIEQLVVFSTREKNVLDLILCTNFKYLPQTFPEAQQVPNDCECIKLVVDVKVTNIKSNITINKPSSFNFKLANYDHIISYLANINWFLLFLNLPSVEDVWNILIAYLNKAISLYEPLVKTKTTHGIPKHIRRLISKKKCYWRHFKKTGIIAYHRNYMNYNKICKKNILIST